MSWLRAAFELLLPPSCADCGHATPELPLCRACRLPVADDIGAAPPPLAGWCAATLHEGHAADWVKRFKYPARGIAGLDLAAEAVALGLMRQLAPQVAGGAPDLVVPIPLHPRRLRERGFSPTVELARALARSVRAPLAPVLLERLRDTPRQTDLSRAARRRNVRGAFRARAAAPAHVWLVDDVVTTGSTLAEAGSALRRAGATQIVGVCLAWRPLLG
jgi:ComF family protein